MMIYTHYENCKCIEECTENIEEVRITSKNEHKNKCSSCILHIVLFSVILAINLGIATYFVYYNPKIFHT